MIKALEYVKQVKPYLPGKPIKELERELGISGCVKMASNENPAGPSPKAVTAINNFMQDMMELRRYPDGSSYYLKHALVKKFTARGLHVDSDNFIIGNGSNELLNMVTRTYVGPGDEAVMSVNSFVVYSMAVTSVGGTPREIAQKDYTHDLEAMADAITPKTKIVFVANPNNPTGTINRRDEFDAFMKRVPDGVLVVMDEAYYEYATDAEYPDTLGTYFAGGRDILVLRTFSKAYGLAGLRVGYGIARKEIIDDVNRLREPFNCNSLAQEAAVAALEDEEHLKYSLHINEEGKKFLYRELSALGVKYVRTEANFIYLPLDREALPLYDALLRKGVIIRPVGPKALRVSIGTEYKNRRFIEALTQSL
jgi:histidinol-phosphate aminotransferase